MDPRNLHVADVCPAEMRHLAHVDSFAGPLGRFLGRFSLTVIPTHGQE